MVESSIYIRALMGALEKSDSDEQLCRHIYHQNPLVHYSYMEQLYLPSGLYSN